MGHSRVGPGSWNFSPVTRAWQADKIQPGGRPDAKASDGFVAFAVEQLALITDHGFHGVSFWADGLRAVKRDVDGLPAFGKFLSPPGPRRGHGGMNLKLWLMLF